jgi:hypothetical protein
MLVLNGYHQALLHLSLLIHFLRRQQKGENEWIQILNKNKK